MSSTLSDGIDNSASEPAPQRQNEAIQHEKLSLSGMRCAACVQLIEFRVRQLPGVVSFNINVVSHRADLAWETSHNSLRKIITAIVDLGYAAFPANQSPDEHERQENKMELWRLFIAGFAMMQIMMYAFPAYLVPVPQVDGDLTPDLDRLLKLASLFITIPVICFSSLPFFRGAIRDIKNRYVGMDVPVSLGILLTFFASIWATFKDGGGAVYYDSAIMFVFLLLGARYIEARVQRKTTAALRVLTQLTPVVAQRMISYPADRHTELVDAKDLQVGDYLLVAAGEQIPADGSVIEGHSEGDESLMTGESRAVVKNQGEKLIAGSINLSGVLLMRADSVGDATQLSALVAMMERAATEKPPLVQLADKHASRFLLIILGVALLTALGWWQIDRDRALWIAISVIVVTCPCALSLATPGVMSAAIGQLAKQGVLIARGRAIESLARATHFVFDKTGTLTYGKLKLLDSMLMAKGGSGHAVTEPEANAISLSLSVNSQHPVSKAIADALSAKPRQQVSTQHALDWSDLHEVAGAGVEAKLNGEIYRLGRLEFVGDLHRYPFEIPAQFLGKTLSALGNEHGWIALYVLEDCLREDALEAIGTLQDRGLKILLLSGDRSDVVQKVAFDCAIADAQGDLSPGEKHEIVRRLQADGAVVVMVGDGMNDGPALSLADVSIVMGQGAPISQSRSDLLLMSNRLTDLAYGVKLSHMALKLIRQNLAWAVAYNVVAIPAAVTGLLEPWHAALGMSLSSLLVVFNALRLLAVNQEVRPLTLSELPD